MIGLLCVLVCTFVSCRIAGSHFLTYWKISAIRFGVKYCWFQEGSQATELGVRQVLGHKFVVKESLRAKHYCEQCSTIIWGVMTQWYRCKGTVFISFALGLLVRLCL